MSFSQKFPDVLTQLHSLPFDYNDGDGIDFEPYQEFQSSAENKSWITAWTGNKTLTGSEYRVFGQDGTGGYAAFWLTKPDADVLDQPIVFFDSEGGLGVVAVDFADYLWLLAGGVGPYESVGREGGIEKSNAAFTTFATQHASTAKKSAAEVVARAQQMYPGFVAMIRALCQ
jgi:hypothetical protein